MYAGTRFEVQDRDFWRVEEGHQLLAQTLEGVSDLLAIEYTNAAWDLINAALMRPVSIFHYMGHTDVDGNRGFLVQEIGTSPLPRPEARVWWNAQYRRLYGSEEVHVDLMYTETLAGLSQRAGPRLAVVSACNSGKSPPGTSGSRPLLTSTRSSGP